MKRKLLSLLMLLMVAMSAMASDYKLYLEISGTTAVLMCGKDYDYNGKPYFNFNSGRWEYGGPWNGMESIESIYVHDTYIYLFVGESLSKLFKGFKNLKTIINSNALNTPNVTDMSEMFSGCSSLEHLSATIWNTSNVTNMSHMFDGCSSLVYIVFNSWDTSKVTDMSYMFSGCSSLTQINITDWDTSKVANTSGMFSGCTSLSKAVTANEGETGEYWATFYDETDGYNYEAPEGTQVFKVTLSGSGITMTEIEDRIVKSGEGVVLKSSSDNCPLTPTIAASSTSYEDNDLQGTTTSQTNPNPGNIYVLNKKSAGIGFYKLKENGSIGANKAYLEVGGGNARDFFLFDETTGVSDARGEMEHAGTYFDLQGRRVAHPTKGLYVVSGKKMVIK